MALTKKQMADEITELAIISNKAKEKAIKRICGLPKEKLEERYNAITKVYDKAREAAFFVYCVAGLQPNWVSREIESRKK